MTTSNRHAAALAVLDALAEIEALALAPDAARPLMSARTDGLDARARLVWQRDAFTGRYSYDALVELDGGATMVLTCAQPSAVPWPLRNAHRWRDSDVVAVNGVTVKIDGLSALFDEPSLRGRIVDGALIRQAIEARKITVGDDELAGGLEAFRRVRGLETVAATEAWLAANQLGYADLERRIELDVAAAKLAEQVAAGREGAWFEEHHAQLAFALWVRLGFAREGEAREAAGALAPRAGAAEWSTAPSPSTGAGSSRACSSFSPPASMRDAARSRAARCFASGSPASGPPPPSSGSTGAHREKNAGASFLGDSAFATDGARRRRAGVGARESTTLRQRRRGDRGRRALRGQTGRRRRAACAPRRAARTAAIHAADGASVVHGAGASAQRKRPRVDLRRL
jgi:putative peptide maturation system protein